MFKKFLYLNLIISSLFFFCDILPLDYIRKFVNDRCLASDDTKELTEKYEKTIKDQEEIIKKKEKTINTLSGAFFNNSSRRVRESINSLNDNLSSQTRAFSHQAQSIIALQKAIYSSECAITALIRKYPEETSSKFTLSEKDGSSDLFSQEEILILFNKKKCEIFEELKNKLNVLTGQQTLNESSIEKSRKESNVLIDQQALNESLIKSSSTDQQPRLAISSTQLNPNEQLSSSRIGSCFYGVAAFRPLYYQTQPRVCASKGAQAAPSTIYKNDAD